MKKGFATPLIILTLAAVSTLLAVGISLQQSTQQPTQESDNLGTAPRVLYSSQVGTNPQADYILSTNGATSTWIENTGGSSGLATTSIDTEAKLESILTDVTDVFTDNDTAFINEADLDATNAPTDNYVLTYNQAGSNFTWEADQTGAGSGGGIATTTPFTTGDLVQVTDSGTVNSIATSSLAINTNDLVEGSNLFHTLARVQNILVGGYNAIFGNSTTTVQYIGDYLSFATTSTQTATTGQIKWNADDQTFDVGLRDDGSVIGQLFQENYRYVKAVEAISDGDVVYASGAVGVSGKIEVNKFIADDSIREKFVIGIATEDISLGEFGFITTDGKVRGISTDGSTVGETWTTGTVLYASSTAAGKLTSVEPIAPNQTIPIAFVVTAHATNGTLEVRYPDTYHIGELHDVYSTSTANKDALLWSSANSRWENRPIVEADISNLGSYLPLSGGTITGDFTVTGNSTTTNATTTNMHVSGSLTANLTGNADTATALAANGSNCASGNSPLGVDAAGAVESCFDVWTEAENTAAAYLQNIVEDTTPQLGGELDAQGNNIIDLADVTFRTGATGGTIRTGTSNADKFELQGYDVDGTAYVKVLEVDAGNDVTLEVFDESFTVRDTADETKRAAFQLGGITTGNTRTLTVQDSSGTLAYTSDLHNAVTLAGEDYLSLATQQITANAINADNLSASDFGDFTCNGTTCSLDANTVNTNEIDLSITPTWTGTHTFSNGTYSALFTGGNVGIGTTTPSAKLHIYGSNEGIRMQSTNPFISFYDLNGNRDAYIQSSDSSYFDIVNQENTDMRFFNNSAERMRITSTGNVGIGTTTPESKMSIVGAASGKIAQWFTSGGTKIMEALDSGIVTLLGSWDFSGATVTGIPIDKSWSIASTSPDYLNNTLATATTTWEVAHFRATTTVNAIYCETDTGTALATVKNGASVIGTATCNTTPTEITSLSNATLSPRTGLVIEIGTGASNPNWVTVDMEIEL